MGYPDSGYEEWRRNVVQLAWRVYGADFEELIDSPSIDEFDPDKPKTNGDDAFNNGASPREFVSRYLLLLSDEYYGCRPDPGTVRYMMLFGGLTRNGG